MTSIYAVMLGIIASLGVFVLISPRTVMTLSIFRETVTRMQFRRNQLVIPLSFLLVFFITDWPIVAFAVTILVAAIPGIGRRPVQSRNEQALVDAIATWTEQLRDTLSGSHGLEQAIVATSAHAPYELQLEVKKLASYIAYGSLENGLRRFGDAINNSTADFVVAALITASQHQARDIVQLLSQIAACARDESKMRSRVWVSRARTRSSIKIIASVISTFVLGLLVFNQKYLEPYSSIQGQLVLSVVFGFFALSFSLMQTMSKIIEPERFVHRRNADNS